MKILFMNGSPNHNGNTAMLAKTLLEGKHFETLNLVDYQINPCGQTKAGDQFNEIIAIMKAADLIVLGSPMYWHNISGTVRVFMDRFYGPITDGTFTGKKLVFAFQGGAPEKWMLETSEYTMKRFATRYGFEYLGMITNTREGRKLRETL